jgi:hypothetical protein
VPPNLLGLLSLVNTVVSQNLGQAASANPQLSTHAHTKLQVTMQAEHNAAETGASWIGQVLFITLPCCA